MEKEAKKYLFWSLIFLVIIISYFVLKDFLVALASAFILAYLLIPFQNKISKKIPKQISALILVILILIVMLALLAIIAGTLITQLSNVINNPMGLAKLKEIVRVFDYNNIISENLSLILSETGKFFFNSISSKIYKFPNIILSLFICMFATYYLLIDWGNIKKKLIGLLPFKNKKEIVKDMEKTTKQIITGTLIIAIIEIIYAFILFKLLGFEYSLLLAFLIGIFAFIPLLGPMLVWAPMALISIFSGEYVVAVLLVIFGLILSFGIDNLLKAKIIGKKTAIHPVIMLVGILGGLKLFGLIGFILGPIILEVLLTIIKNIPKEK
ncbi:MAG: AI-2E family transporter [Candidatus Pacearchaeota archaeon]